MQIRVFLTLMLFAAVTATSAQQSEDAATTDDPAKEGMALAGKVVAAMGGDARLKAIHSLRTKITVTQRTAQGEVPATIVATLVYPDRMHVEMTTPDGPVRFVVTPNSGFRVAGPLVQDLPLDQRNEMLQQIKRDVIYLAQRVSDPGFSVKASGKQTMSDVETVALDLSGPGISVRWYVDPTTNHLAGEAYMVQTRAGAFQSTTMFSDWKTMDGVTLPSRHLDARGGVTTSWAEFQSVEFNPEIGPGLFDRPQAKPHDAKTPESNPKKE